MNFSKLAFALAIAAGSTAPLSVQASTIGSLRVTADDQHVVYIGNADGSALQFVGASVGTWFSAETFSFTAAVSQYLYIVAWNQVSSHALQAEVSIGSDTWTTSDNRWDAVAADNDPLFANGTTAPNASALANAIAAGGWASSHLVRTAATSSPWVDVLGGGVADWLWADAFSGQNDGYQIFRTAVAAHAPAAVPEPASGAMVALALAAAAVAARRRPQQA